MRVIRSAGLPDDVILDVVLPEGPDWSPPADPDERRKMLNRWENAVDDDDDLVLAAPRDAKRQAAVRATQALGGRWIDLGLKIDALSEAQLEDIPQRLELQMDAVLAVADAPGMWGIPQPKDPVAYRRRAKALTAAVVERGEEIRCSDIPILIPDGGTYQVDCIEYRARPANVAELSSAASSASVTRRTVGECSFSGRSYECRCAACWQDRSRAQMLGYAARNRPQPWHARLGGRTGPLIKPPQDDYSPARMRETEDLMRRELEPAIPAR